MILQKIIRLLLISIFSFSVFTTQAQSVKELENQRKKTLQLLESTNKMLNETKKTQRSSMNKLSIINRNILERKNLISNIGKEINELDSEVDRLNQEKTMLEKPYMSAHALGRAFDITVSGMEAEAARKIIVDDSDKLPYPIRLEDGVSWLHVDTMDLCNGQKVTLFNA